MGWFGDKQPPSVRLGSRARRRNGVLYQGDERKRMKGSLSYLADDKKKKLTTHTSRVRPTRARTPARARPPDKFVWKVTEVSHCRYTARCCHFPPRFSSAHHTDKRLFARTRALSCTPQKHTHCYTQLTKSTKKKKIISTRSRELQNLRCFNKTNCLFSCDEAPTAGANEYKHGYVGYKD